jgi:hypothetical protein
MTTKLFVELLNGPLLRANAIREPSGDHAIGGNAPPVAFGPVSFVRRPSLVSTT